MKVKKIIITILITGMLCIIAGIIYILFLNNKSNNTISVNYDTRISEICNSGGCNNKISYGKISYTGNINQIKKVIDNINDKIQKDYQKDKIYEGTHSCQENEINNYYTINDIITYENDKYISITIEESKKYFCQNITKQDPLKYTYFYSKKENKFLTTNEIKKELGIKDKDIKNAIKLKLSAIKNDYNLNYTYKNTFQNGKQNIKIFYGEDGEIVIHFISNEDNNYYLTNIIKEQES